MRIALISQEYPPETAKGGIGSQAYMKAHGLASRGHEVHVISRSPDGNRSERLDGNVHLLRIPGYENRMPVYNEATDWLTYSAEVSVAIQNIHARYSLDLVEFPEWACEGYIHLINQTEWNHIPSVIHLHGPLVMFAETMGWPDKDSDFFRLCSAMEESCLRKTDAVYSSSACSADWCARQYDMDRNAIPVLHTGIDTVLFSPQSVPRDPNPTIVFVGKVTRNKGAVVLAEAACRLASEIPGLRLKLVGRADEPVLKEIRKLTAASGFPDLLDVAGPVSREQLPELLSRSHVFAAPSQYEGGPGFVYLEAMACGIPVIACEGSGAAEVVVPDENGFLVPPNDNDALCNTLRRMLSSELERDRMGIAARNYVLQHADSRTCLDRIEAYYQSVLSRKPENLL
jgi:glycosyltransferase involved in cell wall biosynthesis